MENIKSLDYMPSPTIKAVMANFSYGMSTFNDSELNLWTYDLRFSRGPCFIVSRWLLDFLYVGAPMKWDTKAMESSLNDEIEAGGSLLNQANAEPLV